MLIHSDTISSGMSECIAHRPGLAVVLYVLSSLGMCAVCSQRGATTGGIMDRTRLARLLAQSAARVHSGLGVARVAKVCL